MMIEKKSGKEKKKRRVVKISREVFLLQSGYRPEKTKIGTVFRGKNEVIIGK
ncbi:MAG: hypothetical protein QXJ96_01625 [Candidatus Aenigmatarchaeota archaeon]|nr:hypothetical protein [Candidatus Aenigmarchaeota archaeon]